MRIKSKKGALELSINAIVIVILAMTLLGLGLGFVRGMFKNITDTTVTVQEQTKQQILDDLRTGNKKLSFPNDQVTIESGQDKIISIGVKNTEPTGLSYQIEIYEIVDDPATNIATPVKKISDSKLNTATDKFAYFWDSTSQVLPPGESKVFGIKLKADRTATGTKLFKVKIVDLGQDLTTNTDDQEFDSKSFFVAFV